jgi:hypothetical protein
VEVQEASSYPAVPRGFKWNPCFITTATLKSRNIGSDDAEDILDVFRGFRDEWLSAQVNGPEVIAEYYRVAPSLVEKLDANPRSAQLYKGLWDQYLSRCLRTIQGGNMESTYEIYREMMSDLQRRPL